MQTPNKVKFLLPSSVVISMLGLMGPFLAFAASPAAVNLGAAGNFAILAKTGISTTGNTSVTGDVGVSPAAASYITGFSLALPAAGAYSTSALVSGKVYAPGYADPTPANLTAAVLDMQTAYTDGAGRPASVTELGAGNIGGLTLAPGVYKWGTGVAIPTDVTLSGGANDVWIFEIAQNLTVSSAAKVILAGGAQAGNIFWIVAGQTTLGTMSVFNGNILDQTTIVMTTGARLNGRALAQAAVTMDSNTVITPGASAVSAESSPAATTTLAQTPAYTPYTFTPAYTPAQSMGATDAQKAQLKLLMETLQALQVRSAQAGIPAQVSAAFGREIRLIVRYLTKGNRNADVKTLQEFLIAQNKGPAAQALAAAGASAYFGEMTRAALAEFQKAVGIHPATGNFGALTRSYIWANY